MYILPNGERDVYKIIEITEYEDKLRLIYKPENNIEDLKFEEVEMIFKNILNQIKNKWQFI